MSQTKEKSQCKTKKETEATSWDNGRQAEMMTEQKLRKLKWRIVNLVLKTVTYI